MANGSKIRFFFFLTATVLVLVACNRKENDVIPNTYVNFTLDLNDPEFVNLNTLFGSAYIDQYTNNWGYKSAGFNDNGIILFAGPDEFYAYDRTCPHDYVVNGLSVKVNVDFTEAICPRCSTHYALSAFGTPTSGPGKYPLKNYKTSYDGGRFVLVWNH
jgi:nitrite reductase/ring-hydroxylating ferredoxin subunit